MMNKNSISLISSCIGRDIFGIIEGDNPVTKIDSYFQNINFFSFLSEPLSFEEINSIKNELQYANVGNYLKTNFLNDISKSFVRILKTKKSDWLLIDLSIARAPSYILNNNYYAFHPLSFIYQSIIDREKAPLIKNLYFSKRLDRSEIKDDKLVDSIDNFLKIIKNIYSEKKIIFIAPMYSDIFIKQDCSNLSFFNQSIIDTENEERLVKLSLITCKKKCPKSHFIPTPSFFVGNCDHKWGIAGLHYIDEVYKYYYDCVMEIIQTKHKNHELFFVNALLHYESIAREKIFLATYNHIEKERNILKNDEFKCGTNLVSNQVALTIDKNCNFSIRGNACEDTIFYLINKDKNPIGNWSLLPKKIEKGKYIFSTSVESSEDAFIQLVLSDENGNKKWIYGGICNNSFVLDHDYCYLLVRVIIKKNTHVSLNGKIIISKVSD